MPLPLASLILMASAACAREPRREAAAPEGVHLVAGSLVIGAFAPDARCAEVVPLLREGVPAETKSVLLWIGSAVREYEYQWMTPMMALPADLTVKCDGQGAIVQLAIETKERGGGDASYFSSVRALSQLGRTPYTLRQLKVDSSLRWLDLLDLWLEIERHYRIGRWPTLILREA